MKRYSRLAMFGPEKVMEDVRRASSRAAACSFRPAASVTYAATSASKFRRVSHWAARAGENILSTVALGPFQVVVASSAHHYAVLVYRALYFSTPDGGAFWPRELMQALSQAHICEARIAHVLTIASALGGSTARPARYSYGGQNPCIDQQKQQHCQHSEGANTGSQQARFRIVRGPASSVICSSGAG